MKVVIKEWLKSRRACAWLALWFVTKVAYTVINARITLMISATIAELDNFVQNIILLAAACALQVVLTMLSGMARPMAMNNCYSSASNRYADKILDADVAMFTKFSVAHIDTVSGFLWNITAVGVGWVQMLLNVSSVAITLASMYLVGGMLVLPVIAVYCVGLVATKLLFKKFDAINGARNVLIKRRDQNLENIICGYAEVRAFNMAEVHREEIHGENKEIFDLDVQRYGLNMKVNGLVTVVDGLGLILVILYAVSQMRTGLLTQAAAMSLVMLVFRVIDPLMAILDFTDELSRNLSLAGDYKKIIDYANSVQNNGDIELDEFEDEIAFNDVSFAYDTTNTVLNHLNLTIKKGQKVGICGETGGGKSTMFRLLNKFYMPSSGTITVDGIDINELSTESYRRHLGSVQQENFVFPGTIWENIRYGSPHSTEHEVIEACKRARLYDFIMSLPQKFDTDVGPRGVKLSGGQKQRIALARLFLANPEVILLDEATSALDNQTESFIQEAIDEMADRTIITIAHRLTTIQNCDLIVVMGNKGILESGTHEELMKKEGAYYKMYTASKK